MTTQPQLPKERTDWPQRSVVFSFRAFNLAGLLALAVPLLVPLPLLADPPPQSEGSLRSASGLCLTVHAPASPGAALMLAACDGRAEQRFAYVHLGPRQGQILAPGGLGVSAQLTLTLSMSTPMRLDRRLTLAGRCLDDAAAPRVGIGTCVPGERSQEWSFVH